MNAPVSAAELKEKLKKEKTIEVCGLAFRIRRVPLLFLGDETADFWSIARQGKDALAKRINELIANPKLPQFRRVLLYGVISPKICVGDEDKDAVPVDAILSEYSLAVGLYVEIINFTLDSITKET
ncbi:MAG: hypothetical protein A2270_10490 [Elusimicrobia bacterium RIFOXYA12_FULL_51_18]|nr:MAG: hypothetical protein A2270_10490 [Elusimicrobia bacterium RIFOXYA12_FULL_51_18]OGS29508.1 MAG: hypothetical protein A2218_00700 [Elusimicrobia bacterium RIFOXYA2_FULL_53_38]